MPPAIAFSNFLTHRVRRWKTRTIALPLLHHLIQISQKNNINISDSIPGNPSSKKGIVVKGLYQEEGYYYNSENFKEFEKKFSEIKINNINDNILKDKQKTNEYTFPNVTFLGTTSMKSCKYRGVISILIKTFYNNNQNYFLFDYGEEHISML